MPVRFVESSDFMTSDWAYIDYKLIGHIATRIMNDVAGINRVCHDVSSKPPATIEWDQLGVFRPAARSFTLVDLRPIRAVC